MNTDTVPIESLTLDPANVRRHPANNLDKIKASLTRFGQQRPVLVGADGVIIAGNGTVMAAKALGWPSINIVRSNLKGSEATAYAIADNRTAELAEWDDDALAQQLAALQIEDADLAAAAGFTDAEIAKLAEATVEVQEDETPEPPADPITKPGDLWLLGDHRLLCGDSTKSEDVERLMDGRLPCLLHADPPYGMHLDTDYTRDGGRELGNQYAPVHGDDQPFNAAPFIKHGPKEQLWWGADYYRESLPSGGSWCAWDKWIGKLEPVGNGVEFLWSRQSHKRRVYRYLWSGITAKEKNERRVHPTQKPVALTAEVMNDHYPKWELVFDPFLGSGTTLIAAEQLGRKCYGMEISPAYCDVIVKRWETLTGKKAKRG